ncbi:hypothetical protein HDE80_002258 [Rhodanobacter sp. A1T4]|nr:hypothetical protein [Rhodanobacter sp. A1T4]
MEVSDVLLEAIRSLRSTFHVVLRDSQCLELAFSSVVLAGAEGSHIMSFTSPHSAWAMEWDSVNSNWVARPELSNPASGSVVEAFVKRSHTGYMLSFSDRGSPLVRWGFTAKAIAIRAATQA